MKKKRRTPFHNRYGFIKLGTKVYFEVENQDQWYGDSFGILCYQNGEYVIETERSGTIKTDGHYSAYWNTIRPVLIK